jgi:hypothetical protein
VLDYEVVGKFILTTVPYAFKLRTGTQAAVTILAPRTGTLAGCSALQTTSCEVCV